MPEQGGDRLHAFAVAVPILFERALPGGSRARGAATPVRSRLIQSCLIQSCRRTEPAPSRDWSRSMDRVCRRDALIPHLSANHAPGAL